MVRANSSKPSRFGGIFFTVIGVCFAVTAWAEPMADRVAPQRLTLFVGQGEQRVRIEGEDLEQVDEVVAYDTSTTGQSREVPEVKTRILNVDEGVMTVILRADSAPDNGERLQLALMFGHRGYMIPANLFQMDVQ